jgi:dTDP-4-amino-4,6-dideoxygalactose transaminase
MLPFLDLQQVNTPYLAAIQQAIERVTSSGRYILGSEVRDFETNFGNYSNAQFCVAVGNGSDAIELILRGYDFPSKSEIIVAANTYIATVLPVIQLGLIPVPVEPDAYSLQIDVERIEEKITSRTKALLVTHLYGKSCKMDVLQELAQKYDLKLIADAAQAHAATYQGKCCTTYCDASAFSFYPTKNLGAMGDAGAVVTDDTKLALKLTALRNYGSHRKYLNKYPGINSRMDDLQAAILNVKLPHLQAATEHRRQLARMYLETIKVKDLLLPPSDSINDDVWHLFVVRHPQREQFLAHLAHLGIGTDIHYPIPFHLQEAFSEYRFPSLPITEAIHNQAFSLPLSTALTEAQARDVAAAVNSFMT